MGCRRPAIIWTNDGIGWWRIFASLGLNELTKSPLVESMTKKDHRGHMVSPSYPILFSFIYSSVEKITSCKNHYKKQRIPYVVSIYVFHRYVRHRRHHRSKTHWHSLGPCILVGCEQVKRTRLPGKGQRHWKTWQSIHIWARSIPFMSNTLPYTIPLSGTPTMPFLFLPTGPRAMWIYLWQSFFLLFNQSSASIAAVETA